jgi:peptidoglycan/xylan/chitin deacetylase (PgdA/CDA1 family)
VLRHGLEPLAENGFRAIQFLVAGFLGRRSEWQAQYGEVLEPLMDASQVREWLAAGHEIGAHTLTHPWLTRVSELEAREEIRGSRLRLEDLFGVPVRHFCYPYGDWNPAVRDLVQEAGFATACTVEFGVNAAATPHFELRRVTARYRSRNLRNLLGWLWRWR